MASERDGKRQFVLELQLLNWYGLWFAAGLTAVHISRLIPNGFIVYAAFLLFAIVYLIGVDNKKQRAHRLSIAALVLSILGFWDLLFWAVNYPITVFGVVFPVWVLIVSIFILFMLLLILLNRR